MRLPVRRRLVSSRYRTPSGRVDGWIERFGLVENAQADDVFLEVVSPSCRRFFHDEPEEP
jgi:hypothetical protein